MTGVSNSQLANQTTFNGAFIGRNGDSNTVGKLDLNNQATDALSGTDIVNLQKNINALCSALGIAPNQAADLLITWANAYVGLASSNSVSKIEAVVAKFRDTVAHGGHAHTGANGDGPQLSITDIANINQLRAEFQNKSITGASGTSMDVTTQFSGETSGGGTGAIGVITSAPNNRVYLVDASTETFIEDSGGQRVYGRITYSTGTWTLSFFTNEGGTETAHTLSSTNLNIYFLKVFTLAQLPTIPSSPAQFGTLDVTADVVDASSSVRGVVSISAQAFAGLKTFVNMLKRASATGITAFAGGGQGSATALTKDINEISTVATAGDSVKLPAALAGAEIVVINSGANSLNVFPETGEAIDALGTNVAYSISTSAKNVRFICSANGSWKSAAGGTGGGGLTGASNETGGGEELTGPVPTFIWNLTVNGDLGAISNLVDWQTFILSNNTGSDMNLLHDDGYTYSFWLPSMQNEIFKMGQSILCYYDPNFGYIKVIGLDAANLLNNKGDLLTHSGGNPVVRSVGANGSVLTAESSDPSGMVWAAPSAAPDIPRPSSTTFDFSFPSSPYYLKYAFKKTSGFSNIQEQYTHNGHTYTVAETVGDFIYLNGTGAPLTSGTLTYVGTNTQEITEIQCVPEFGALNNTSFKIYDENGSVGVWFNVAGAGSIPTQAAACTRALMVPLAGAETAAQVAIAVQTVLDADSKFTAVVDPMDATKVDVTLDIAIDVSDAADGLTLESTGMTFTVLQQGAGLGTATIPFSASYRPKYLDVLLIGAGGGGMGGGLAAGNSSAGGDTWFGSTNFRAGGGGANTGTGTGWAIVSTTPSIAVLAQSRGGNGPGKMLFNSGNGKGWGAPGCSGPFGGSGTSNTAASGGGGDTGGGGGGGGCSGTANVDIYGGGGGSSGAMNRGLIRDPLDSYPFSVGAGGTGGSAGTNGFAGGPGGNGFMTVAEHY